MSLPEATVEEYTNQLRFPAVAPAMACISSSHDLAPQVPEGVEARIGRVIERERSSTVETVAGRFVADPP